MEQYHGAVLTEINQIFICKIANNFIILIEAQVLACASIFSKLIICSILESYLERENGL